MNAPPSCSQLLLPADTSHDAADIPTHAPTEGFDRWLHAQTGRWTSGVSPSALMLAYADWMAHLATSPGRQAYLVHKAFRKWFRLALYLLHAGQPGAPRAIDPLPQDRRFVSDAWTAWPYNVWSQAFLLTQQWWHNATTGVRGVSRHHEQVVTFSMRQWLDLMSPSNFVVTNPEVLDRTIRTLGTNLVAGMANAWEDVERRQAGRPGAGAERFVVGRDVAVTPGKVVMRNELAELLQYEPATETVHPEPVLILPAWIMKYYVLDLRPQNSLIRHLVEQGHTVFCVSWKNPTEQHRDHGLEDYLRLGFFEPLAEVRRIVPERKVHAAGYCLGGTLLAIGAAALAARGRDELATLTLLAAQTEFSEPGEIGLFIDDAEVTFLEDVMFDRGYLTRDQMAGSFQLLRSNDLIWSRAVREYLMGERAEMTDLMSWNQDATRMPYRMHSEYLRSLFLHNDLAAGRFRVDGRPVALADIRVPVFCLGTEADHVARWPSVYKIHLLTDTEVTFVLASGGHNVGVVNPPSPRRGGYRMHVQGAGDAYLDPDHFLACASRHEGSWWPCWSGWLADHSSVKGPAPSRRASLGDAPGTYVLES